MAAYAPLSPTDILNLALQEVGSPAVDSIDDTNEPRALAGSAAFWQSVRETGRAHNWNCLKKRQNLAPLTPPLPGNTQTWFGWPGTLPTTPPPYWAAHTAYTGGTLVTYGEAIYYCLLTYTSGFNFINDLTAGYWAQIYSSFYGTNTGNAGGMYEWRNAFALPNDYLLITELNGNDCTEQRGLGSLYEIYVVQTPNPANQSTSNQLCLFCNAPNADVKYTAFIQDTTIYDPLFVGALAIILASKISTVIRGDDGKMAQELRQRFVTDVLPNARMKDAGERKDRRYDPTRESNFLRSRWGSTAG
jgi:hypothetical protein